MTWHLVAEIVAVAGVLSAVFLAWGSIVIRLGRRHIDTRCAETIKDEVAEIIGNGVTERINRLEDKLDKVIEYNMWDGNERRGQA